ncbi:uncharacterized protein LOC143025586 isoform X2 [Oratosquilla oratoria]|uniref:uncharacterized protein LOC143025586 isoform X2 n=1 Tax=Oratosquilla oratoria TaxID=337810 RepID=UPI003F770F70
MRSRMHVSVLCMGERKDKDAATAAGPRGSNPDGGAEEEWRAGWADWRWRRSRRRRQEDDSNAQGRVVLGNPFAPFAARRRRRRTSGRARATSGGVRWPRARASERTSGDTS